MINPTEGLSERRTKLFHISALCCSTPEDALRLAQAAEAWIYDQTPVAPPAVATSRPLPAAMTEVSQIQLRTFGDTGKCFAVPEQPDPGVYLNRMQRLVWYVIARMVSTTGHSPSSPTIAFTTNLGVNDVPKAIVALDDKQYIKKTGNKNQMKFHVLLWPKDVIPRETVGLGRYLDDPMYLAPGEVSESGATHQTNITRRVARVKDDIYKIQLLTFGPMGHITQLPPRTAQDAELAKNRFLVWCTLAQMISVTGHSPSGPAIAAAANISLNTVVRALDDLNEAGYLRTTGQRSTMKFHVLRWPEGITPRETIGFGYDLDYPNYEPPKSPQDVAARPSPPVAEEKAPAETQPVLQTSRPVNMAAVVARQAPAHVSIESLIAYLNDTGHRVEVLPGARFKINDEVVTAMRFIAMANNVRVRDNLPIFISDVNERTVAPGSSLG